MFLIIRDIFKYTVLWNWLQRNTGSILRCLGINENSFFIYIRSIVHLVSIYFFEVFILWNLVLLSFQRFFLPILRFFRLNFGFLSGFLIWILILMLNYVMNPLFEYINWFRGRMIRILIFERIDSLKSLRSFKPIRCHLKLLRLHIQLLYFGSFLLNIFFDNILFQYLIWFLLVCLSYLLL